MRVNSISKEVAPSSGFLVFASLLRDQETLTAEAYELLEHIWAYYDQTPSLVIYLDVPAETCLHHIRERNRPGEESITLEYLQAVESKYQEYLDLASGWTEVVRVSNLRSAEASIIDFLQTRDLPYKKKKRFFWF